MPRSKDQELEAAFRSWKDETKKACPVNPLLCAKIIFTDVGSRAGQSSAPIAGGGGPVTPAVNVNIWRSAGPAVIRTNQP